MVTLYRDADVVALVSTYEGFGLPILEGNATGRPVVTSNVYSMPEVAGGSACLVDPFNIASIRHGFIRVFTDEAYRTSLVEAGLDNVGRFRSFAVAQAYASVYWRVAEDNS